ncbi:MAG: outer membrane beta-barrel protein, partial [Hyphomonadaceae bacterium]
MAQTVENESVSVRDRPRPETDPLGARVGGFDLFARLDLGVTTTDNLFAEETNEDDDIIYSIAPHLRLTSHWSRHQIEADAGGRATMHDDFDNEDAETYYAGIRGRLDIGGNSNVSGGARLAHEVESRTDPDAPTGGDPVEYDITNVFVRGEHT